MARLPRLLSRRVVRRVGRSRLFVALAMLGPGLIAANAGNDAGGITTWSVIGSRYGYSMIWLLVVITPVLAVVQEMNARVGVVTGRGLAGLIRENFSLKVTALAILATALANFGTTVAEFSGIAAAGQLFHIPSYVAVPALAVAVWLLVTRGSYRKVERVLLALGFVLVTYVIAGLMAGPDWGAAARGAVAPRPELDSLWVFTVIAAVGTTLTPWGQFFIQAAVVDRKISLRQYV
jgi:NRAMP (natural resistance-associated macrophage protein)-like metal ion transporter